MASKPKLVPQGEKEIPKPTELPAEPIMKEEEQMPLPGPQPQTDIPGQRQKDEQHPQGTVTDADKNVLRDPFWE